MSEKDLVKELKAEVVEITKDRDDALAKVKSKESRMKQVLIKLEHREQDIQTCGHKIGEQNKEIADLKAKLETKSKLLDEALQKIKDTDDHSSKETDTDTDDKELDYAKITSILNPYFIAVRNNSIKNDYLPLLGDFFKKLV